MPDPERDARVLRRAARAGVAVFGVLAVLLVTAVVLSGAGGRQGLAAVMLALTFGLLAASAWLILAAGTDLLAGQPPGRRRVIWTVVVAVSAFISPMLILGAQGGA